METTLLSKVDSIKWTHEGQDSSSWNYYLVYDKNEYPLFVWVKLSKTDPSKDFILTVLSEDRNAPMGVSRNENSDGSLRNIVIEWEHGYKESTRKVFLDRNHLDTIVRETLEWAGEESGDYYEIPMQRRYDDIDRIPF